MCLSESSWRLAKSSCETFTVLEDDWTSSDLVRSSWASDYVINKVCESPSWLFLQVFKISYSIDLLCPWTCLNVCIYMFWDRSCTVYFEAADFICLISGSALATQLQWLPMGWISSKRDSIFILVKEMGPKLFATSLTVTSRGIYLPILTWLFMKRVRGFHTLEPCYWFICSLLWSQHVVHLLSR